MRVKVVTVPPRYQEKLRQHTLTSPDSTLSERAKARPRDEKGRLLPNPAPIGPHKPE